MPALLLASPAPLAGKTTLAAGLARNVAARGKSVALRRLGGDRNAAADSALFESFPGVSRDAAAADLIIAEAAAGDVSGALEDVGDGRVVVVATPEMSAADVKTFCGGLGGAFAGVVLNRVSRRRTDSVRAAFQTAGVRVIALLPEDRVLAAPVLSEVVAALKAQVSFMDDSRLYAVDRPLIASISADPGQGYFLRTSATAVIVRSDKPDLQLGAINAGANCLIITGGLPVLSYVLDRAEEDGIPLLRTDLDTVQTVASIETLFGAGPFAGGEAKMGRIGALLGDLDVSTIIGD